MGKVVVNYFEFQLIVVGMSIKIGIDRKDVFLDWDWGGILRWLARFLQIRITSYWETLIKNVVTVFHA